MEFAILSFFVLAGVVGTLMPLIPGSSLILVGAGIYAAMTGFEIMSGTDLAILAVLSLTGGLGQYLIAGFGAKTLGSSRAGALGATVGFVIGLLLPVPGGVFVGTFGGAFLAEVVIAVKGIREGLKSGLGAALAAVVSLFFEFFVAVVMVALILYRVLDHLPG